MPDDLKPETLLTIQYLDRFGVRRQVEAITICYVGLAPLADPGASHPKKQGEGHDHQH